MTRFMQKLIRRFIDRILGAYLSRNTKTHLHQIPAINQQLQISLRLKYQELLRTGAALPKFPEIEFRCFSQNGEDGILLYLFSLIGTVNKKAVEICIGNGMESNTANLIINHGWEGLLFEGDDKNISMAKNFYETSKDTFLFPPKIVKAWITAENVNELLADDDFAGEIDLLSLDIDGMDYWVLKAITAVNPRVITLEYHEEFGFEAVTVPYDAEFDRTKKNLRYFGASLPTFVKLLGSKGYRLVGANHQKFNAFFIRQGVGAQILPEVSIESCLRQKDPRAYTLLEELKQYPFEKT